MQKIISFLPILIFLFILSSCSKKLHPEGNYQKTTVVADAELNDWSLPLRFGNKAGTIQYSITNDKQNIYVALLSKDEATEQKILKMGMTVYFDPAGGDNKAIGINFPMKSQVNPRPEEKKETGIEGVNANLKTRKQEMMLQSTEFTITGFQHLENRSYDLKDKHAIQVALKTNDENNLAYEAVVPLKNILGNAMTPNDAVKNFSVGIVIKGFQNTRNSGGNSNGRSGEGSRGMGGGRGGMGGGRGAGGGRGMSNRTAGDGSGRNSDRTALFKDDVNWYTFRLALQ